MWGAYQAWWTHARKQCPHIPFALFSSTVSCMPIAAFLSSWTTGLPPRSLPLASMTESLASGTFVCVCGGGADPDSETCQAWYLCTVLGVLERQGGISHLFLSVILCLQVWCYLVSSSGTFEQCPHNLDIFSSAIDFYHSFPSPSLYFFLCVTYMWLCLYVYMFCSCPCMYVCMCLEGRDWHCIIVSFSAIHRFFVSLTLLKTLELWMWHSHCARVSMGIDWGSEMKTSYLSIQHRALNGLNCHPSPRSRTLQSWAPNKDTMKSSFPCSVQLSKGTYIPSTLHSWKDGSKAFICKS